MSASGGDPNGGPRVFLNGATIMTTPTAEHIRVAREAGFDGVEVRAERLLDRPEEVAAASPIVQPREVWSLNGLQLQVGPDGRLDGERAERELSPRLAISGVLGAEYLLVVPPRQAGVDRGRAIEAMREGLALVRDRAAAVGVGVAFEFLGFADCPIDSPALAAEVVGPMDGVDLVLDSCHWHASGSASLADFPVDRLAMVHLNDAPGKPPREIEDADRVLPGNGVIRLADLVAQLTARGYGGPWSLETFNPTYWAADPRRIASEGRRRVGALLGEPSKVAG
ncbi:MAG: sugar phosphate isomerase/epimerase [Chloroflexi bacterium]|nr:MAG: sugar phosphate isomerase/epimerase [Chloroflexota bacterium]